MGQIVVGAAPATKSLMRGYPIKVRDESGNWMLEYAFKCAEGTAKSEAAAHGDSPPSPEVGDPDFADLRCSRVEIRSDGDVGVQSVIREIYVLPSASGHAHFPGEVIRSSVAAVIEKPIEEHSSLTSVEIETARANGRETFFAASVMYRRRTTDSSIVWSQANIVGTLNTRVAPTGMTSPTANRWLHVERSMSEDTGSVEDAYQYDQGGWDTGIFD